MTVFFRNKLPQLQLRCHVLCFLALLLIRLFLVCCITLPFFILSPTLWPYSPPWLVWLVHLSCVALISMCSSLTLPVCSRYPVCTKQLVLFLDFVWAHPLWTNILDMTLACLGPVSFNFNKLSYLIEPLYLPHLHLGPNSGLRCFGTGTVTQIEYLKQVED